MNKHIELVKKWLADKDSVSLQELKTSAKSSCAAHEMLRDKLAVNNINAAAYADAAAFAVDYAAHYAAYRATYYGAYAANFAYYGDDAAYFANHSAAYWVKRYEELVNE